MKTLTLNMFAETNEDLPIISGMTHTQPFAVEQPQYDDDGLNGYYLGCEIHITQLGPDDYNVAVHKKFWTNSAVHLDTLADAHAKAEYFARYFDRFNP